MARAAQIARFGASSSPAWMPNTAITASPMNFSTTPPLASMQRCQRTK